MVLGTENQPIEVDYQVGFSGCRKGCIQYLMILVIQRVAKNFRGGGYDYSVTCSTSMEGRVFVMSVSISDFKRGDIVILAEGAPGAYGKYKVAECDGGSIAFLAEYSFGGAFRYILKPYSGEEEAPFGMGNPHVLYKSVLWSSGSSNLGGGADDKSQAPYEVLVDVVRVFPDGDEAAANEYLKAVVAARDLLVCEGGRVSCDVPVAPLNNRLSNPHIVRSGDVDGIVAALEADADSKFERFLHDCVKFRDSIIYFAVSEWDYLDAFMKKVESEPTRLGSKYTHLVDGATGITPVGLFVGDIIRVGASEGIEYLQVVDVAPDGFKMKNLTRGGIDTWTLVVQSERVEGKKSGEAYYILRIVLEGVIVDEWCYCFAVLPTRNPALIDEFDTLYTMQSKLIGSAAWRTFVRKLRVTRTRTIIGLFAATMRASNLPCLSRRLMTAHQPIRCSSISMRHW